MRVYKEFLIDENTRAVEVRWIDESTGREIAGPGAYGPPQSRGLDWALLAQRGARLEAAGSTQLA